MNASMTNVFNGVAVIEGSRGFQPTDKCNQHIIRRVATIEPERLP